jgi:hypothetical protein
VQLLIDWGPEMEPFRRDQAELTERVKEVAGRECVEVLYFSESPLDGCGPGSAWTWKKYGPPPPGTRVLILSDLGLARRRAAGARGRVRADFGTLARRLAARECAAVALVPVSPGRWPPHPPLRLVAWDRSTTVPTLSEGR